MTRSAHILPTALFGLGWGLYLAVLFPGFMSNDSVHQLLEARNGQIGDWHSPFMTWLFGVLDSIYPGPAGMFLVQISLLWGGLWLFWHAALAPLAPRLGAALLFALMFYPAVLGVNGGIWKDILMAGAVMVMTGAIANLYTGRLPRSGMLVLALLSALLALLARTNAIFLIFPLMVFLVLCILRWRRPARLAVDSLSAMVAGATLSIMLCLGAMSVNGQIATRALHPILSIALFDVSGTIAHLDDADRQNQLYAELPSILTLGRTVQDLTNSYSPRDWQTVFNGEQPGLNPLGQFQTTYVAGYSALTDAQRSAILTSWYQAITTEPRAYIAHRIAVFDWVLAFRKALWQPVMFDPANYPEALQQVVPPFSIQTALQSALTTLFGKMSFYAPYKPWLCLTVALILISALVFRPAGRGLEIALLLTVPAHLFGIFLLAPTPDYRYSHVIFLTTGLAITGALCKALAARHST